MGKKNLVQELREVYSGNACDLAHEICDLAHAGEIVCSKHYDCAECIQAAFNALADRIEAEYDPKPEPDTLEKVAKEMDSTLHHLKSVHAIPRASTVEEYRKRLEALGVTFDD